MVAEKKISQPRACRWRSRVRVGMSRNALRGLVVLKDKEATLREQIETLAHRHKQWGVLKIYRHLRKQGELSNHKRIRRLTLPCYF